MSKCRELNNKISTILWDFETEVQASNYVFTILQILQQKGETLR